MKAIFWSMKCGMWGGATYKPEVCDRGFTVESICVYRQLCWMRIIVEGSLPYSHWRIQPWAFAIWQKHEPQQFEQNRPPDPQGRQKFYNLFRCWNFQGLSFSKKKKKNRDWPRKASPFFHCLFDVAKSLLIFHQSHRILYLIATSFTQQHPPSHSRFAWRVLMLQKFPLPRMAKLFGACKGNPSTREQNLCQIRHLPIHPVSSQPLLTATSHSSCKPRDVPPCLLCRRPTRSFLI